jgi:hypothetical protein
LCRNYSSKAAGSLLAFQKRSTLTIFASSSTV